jgi:hypothetical protein
MTAPEAGMPISTRRADAEATPHLIGTNAPSSIHDILETEEVRAETPNPQQNDQVDVEPGPKLDFDLKMNVGEDRATRNLRVNRNTMSGLSIILTLMSIIVAFR